MTQSDTQEDNMTKPDILELALEYVRLGKAAQRWQGDTPNYTAVMNQRYGIRLAAIALDIWEELQTMVQSLEEQGLK
jgi:hypothetical protein